MKENLMNCGILDYEKFQLAIREAQKNWNKKHANDEIKHFILIMFGCAIMSVIYFAGVDFLSDAIIQGIVF